MMHGEDFLTLCGRSQPLGEVFTRLAHIHPKKSLVGSGRHATVRRLPDGSLLKCGELGPFEAIAMNKANALKCSGVPKIYGSTRNVLHTQAAQGHSLKRLISSHQIKAHSSTDIAESLIKTLRDLHSAGISHGDLHWGNCFWCMETNKLTLIDYGNAKLDQQSACVEALSFLIEKKSGDGGLPVFRALPEYEKGAREQQLRLNLATLGKDVFAKPQKMIKEIYAEIS